MINRINLYLVYFHCYTTNTLKQYLFKINQKIICIFHLSTVPQHCLNLHFKFTTDAINIWFSYRERDDNVSQPRSSSPSSDVEYKDAKDDEFSDVDDDMFTDPVDRYYRYVDTS